MVIQIAELRRFLESKHRGAAIYSIYDQEKKVPPQAFYITRDFVSSLEKEFGKEISSEKFIEMSVKNTLGCVSDKFSSKTLNNLNSLYFSSCPAAFSKTSGLATFYVSRPQVQHAFMKRMLEQSDSDKLRIHEICSGTVLSRWQFMDKWIPKGKRFDVTVSDIAEDLVTKEQIAKLGLKKVNLEYEAYDLREDFNKKPEDQKYDVLFTTYGFDSVWHDDDKVYEKIGGKWYLVEYRLRVDPGSVHFDRVLSALQKGVSSEPISLDDFNHVGVEILATEIDIKKAKYGEVIEKTYEDYEFMMINFPGGLLDRVEQAFARQLNKNGMFLIGDVVNYPLNPGEKLDPNMNYFNTTGRVGKYKVEDYYLAEIILKQKGFKAEIHDVRKFTEKYGKTFEEDSADTYVMIVTR
jgi:hypothetical protein